MARGGHEPQPPPSALFGEGEEARERSLGDHDGGGARRDVLHRAVQLIEERGARRAPPIVQRQA